MNRREFVKETFAVAGAAVFGLGCSKEASANETSTTNNAATPLPSTEKQGEKKTRDNTHTGEDGMITNITDTHILCIKWTIPNANGDCKQTNRTSIPVSVLLCISSLTCMMILLLKKISCTV